MIWRWAVGLPSLPTIYQEYWYQVTGIPGTDLIRAIQTMFFGGISRQGEFTLWFDFFCVILLAVTTYFVFRRLNVTYGLYSVMLLLFMLLPVSEFKPLYSFSRYTLAFFPTFMILAYAGKNPWVNRHHPLPFLHPLPLLQRPILHLGLGCLVFKRKGAKYAKILKDCLPFASLLLRTLCVKSFL